jgi:hypothetical protein
MSKTKTKRPQTTESRINRGVARLIEAHADKNYSAAHKYLVGVVEAKLKQKINSHLDKPLF